MTAFLLVFAALLCPVAALALLSFSSSRVVTTASIHTVLRHGAGSACDEYRVERESS